jgi:hypothetical protein
MLCDKDGCIDMGDTEAHMDIENVIGAMLYKLNE